MNELKFYWWDDTKPGVFVGRLLIDGFEKIYTRWESGLNGYKAGDYDSAFSIHAPGYRWVFSLHKD